MLAAENWIDENWDRLFENITSDEEISRKLNLSVQFVDPLELHPDSHAELAPPVDSSSNGVIRISNVYATERFSYMHEIMHYIHDVGIGNKVSTVYARKKKGAIKDHHEQVIDYYAAAICMRYNNILTAISGYDKERPYVDELEFVKNLCSKYNQGTDAVLRRVKEVRQLKRARSI